MRKINALNFILISLLIMSCKQHEVQYPQPFEPFKPLMSYDDAAKKADSIIATLSIDEKIALIGGYNSFFVKGVPSAKLPDLYLSDATQGVHIRKYLSNQLEKSTAFPCPIALAATWDPQLAHQYAKSIGEECRAGDIAVLLGPGMNSYRIAQNGRNFEYFGEDPFLAARMIEQYVTGMQSTGTITTLKHFVCNNTDHHRRRSNSVVDERTMHEIYLPAFQAGIDAGAMAVMTSYNQVNGEYAAQNHELVTGILRGEMGFKWLVMSDWWSVWDPLKTIKSGVNLDMPGDLPTFIPGLCIFGDITVRANAKRLLTEGKVTEEEISRMAREVVSTSLAMGLDKRPVQDSSFLATFPKHEETALQTAREAIVLLRNENGTLPLKALEIKKILLTGEYADKVAKGGGSAEVEGYNEVNLLSALNGEFGEKVVMDKNPTEELVKEADVVIAAIGTYDSEGWNKSTAFPDSVNQEIIKLADQAKKLVVVVYSGSGMEMGDWNEKTDALIYAWYPGQNGNKALAEILAGKTNPSGKLPITIEKKFEDSPGYPYKPADEALYSDWGPDNDMAHPIFDIVYKEGVFTGYRWYEKQKIQPLYWFGYGLTYTTFELSDLKISPRANTENGYEVMVSVKNSGTVAGTEVVQVYVTDQQASVERPAKELKAFARVALEPGQEKKVVMYLDKKAFAFWDVETHGWKVEPGEFTVHVGDASDRLVLNGKIEVQ
jgi:beta-glucosidase